MGYTLFEKDMLAPLGIVNLAIAARGLASGHTAHSLIVEYTCFPMAALNVALALACSLLSAGLSGVCVVGQGARQPAWPRLHE